MFSSVISNIPAFSVITITEDPQLSVLIGNIGLLDQEICQISNLVFSFNLATPLNAGDHILLIFPRNPNEFSPLTDGYTSDIGTVMFF